MNTRTFTRLLTTACMLACLATSTAQAQRMYNSSGRPIGRIDGEHIYSVVPAKPLYPA